MCELVSITTNCGTRIKVADIKKKYIENIIDAASLCKQITAIILFGSALKESCTIVSDIDIAIISNQTVNRLSQNKSFSKFVETIYKFDFTQEYDRLYFKSIEEIERKKNEIPICKELSEQGKIIYRRVS